MKAEKEKIIEGYESGNEDERYHKSRNGALEFHYTKKHLSAFITPESRVIEIGCATGYYGMYYADKCAEYLGIDVVPKHVSIFREKIAAAGLTNVSCQLGDATDLSSIPDGSFDVVLCLGPMYHLSSAERDAAFEECARICKKGGIAAFAYINALGLYAGGCVMAGDKYPNEQCSEAVFVHGTDDLRPGLFWYTTPEEIEAQAASAGFEKLRDLGTEVFLFEESVNAMDDGRFELMRPLYDRITSSESCTGMCGHALLICKK